ncbi:hypothetical protein ACET3Z_011178 [Daucus carota]
MAETDLRTHFGRVRVPGLGQVSATGLCLPHILKNPCQIGVECLKYSRFQLDAATIYIYIHMIDMLVSLVTNPVKLIKITSGNLSYFTLYEFMTQVPNPILSF